MNTKCSSCSLAGTRCCETCEDNPNGRSIKITSSRFSDFTSDVIVDGVRYHVQTEKGDATTPVITTRVIKDGEILSSRRSGYRHLLGRTDFSEELEELMRYQHLFAIDMLKAEKPRERKSIAAYIEGVENFLKAGDPEGALRILDVALTEHPFSAYLLSYHGYLDATVNGNCGQGIDLCRTAIEILREELVDGLEGLLSIPYLNLGRAYLASDAKNDAAEAFRKGLEADPEHGELLREARKLGMRRRPIIPVLKRSNPINKYGGLLLQRSHIRHLAGGR